MCGICGIVNNHSQHPVSPDLLTKMTDTLTHRGPDEAGFFVKGNVGLGMRRLKIIDLFTGKQPIFNEDRTVSVVLNGEIYNYVELRADLEKRGHHFYTRSDTEVIVHLYEQYGEDFLAHLNGMFAIGLWDDAAQKLLLARDRLGEKPLYYTLEDQGIRFASELKAFLADPDFPREIDPAAIYHYFTYIAVPAPHTIYRQVRKLRPGHYLRYQSGRAEIVKYWDVHFDPQHHWSEAYVCEQLRALLTASLRQRLRCDVPFGAFLSGGIDSTVVVGLMSEILAEPVQTFSIGFKEDRYNELDYARQVAERFGTKHHEFIVAPTAVGLLDKLIWHFDEPFAGPSAIPTYFVSKLARKYVTVVLTGDGGDEVFLGYDRYQRMLRRRKFTWLPMPVRRLLAKQIGDRLPAGAYGKRYLQSMGLDDMYYYNVYLTEYWKRQMFSPDFLQSIPGCDSFSVVEHSVPDRSQEYLSRLNYFDLQYYLSDNVLVKVDRMTMANSLESRALFLDHRIVEFAAKIPTRLKMKNGVTKYILRQSCRDLLPPAIRNRGKWGFALPVDEWFRGELRELITEKVEATRQDGMFNYPFLAGILREHLSGRRDHYQPLWAFLILQKWFEVFSDKFPAGPLFTSSEWGIE